MEQHSQTDDTRETRSILEGQLRESYGRVVYSHKTHEKCADILLTRLARIRLAQIILSALTTAGFVGAAFGAGRVSAILGLIVSTTLLALNAYIKNYNLGELAQRHRQAANDLWIVREKYMNLLVDLAMREKPLEGLQKQRDELVENLHTVYSAAPNTIDSGYKSAQVALKENEEMTFSDAEIDAFLPKELRRELIGRDLRPFPETPEAKARGCQCNIVRNHDGAPELGEDGRIIYSFTKGCPIPNHN